LGSQYTEIGDCDFDGAGPPDLPTHCRRQECESSDCHGPEKPGGGDYTPAGPSDVTRGDDPHNSGTSTTPRFVQTGPPSRSVGPADPGNSETTCELSRGSCYAADPACRASVVAYGTLLEAIIDTGATFTLMSMSAWIRIRDYCGPLRPATVNLHGASGAGLKVHGTSQIEFALQGVPYVYDVCIAEIWGIDVLVGLDFLIDVGPLIDLARLQVTLGNESVCQYVPTV
jgi:hypothetical protein